MAFETLDADYANLRGCCYLPVYPSLNTAAGEGWVGVTGPDVAWDEYDGAVGTTSGEVAAQLAYLKLIGFNAVRIWLPFNPSKTGYDSYAYATDAGTKAAFIVKFDHFLSLAKTAEIYVIPVLFDNFTMSPSNAELATTVASQNDYDASDANEFIDSLLLSKASYPTTLLFFDLYNEPWTGQVEAVLTNRQKLISFAADQINTDNAAYKTLVGAGGWPLQTYAQTVMADANVDVLSIHPYGIAPTAITASIADVTDQTTKTLIITEMGSNGAGSLYSEKIATARAAGVGWCIYHAMIGWNDAVSEYLHLDGSGMMYSDGTVHRMEDARAVWDAATADSAAGLHTDAELRAKLIGTGDALYHIKAPTLAADIGGWEYLKYFCYNEHLLDSMTNEELISLCGTQQDGDGGVLQVFTNYDLLIGSLLQNDPWSGQSRVAVAAAKAAWLAGPSLATAKAWLAAVKEFVVGTEALRYICTNKTYIDGRLWQPGDIMLSFTAPSSANFDLFTDRTKALDIQPYTDCDGTYYTGTDVWKMAKFPSSEKGFTTTADYLEPGRAEGVINFSDITVKDTALHQLNYSFQLPKSWKVGSTIYPHVHWKQNQAGDVAWVLYYRTVIHDGAISALSSAMAMDQKKYFYKKGGTTRAQINSTSAGISTTGLLPGDFVEINIGRSSVDDGYVGDAGLTQFSISYQEDSIGSGKQFAK